MTRCSEEALCLSLGKLIISQLCVWYALCLKLSSNMSEEEIPQLLSRVVVYGKMSTL